MKSLILVVGISLWLTGCGDKDAELENKNIQFFPTQKNSKVLSYEENVRISRETQAGSSNEEK